MIGDLSVYRERLEEEKGVSESSDSDFGEQLEVIWRDDILQDEELVEEDFVEDDEQDDTTSIEIEYIDFDEVLNSGRKMKRPTQLFGLNTINEVNELSNANLVNSHSTKEEAELQSQLHQDLPVHLEPNLQPKHPYLRPHTPPYCSHIPTNQINRISLIVSEPLEIRLVHDQHNLRIHVQPRKNGPFVKLSRRIKLLVMHKEKAKRE